MPDHPAARARLVSEARIAGQLEHPNIVPAYALGYESNGRPYYAMKLVKGRTLQQAIREHHREPSTSGLRALLRTLVGVCQAVAYAHSKGIVHRDLKPANIMVGDFGETLILDWGVAKHMADGSARADGPSADSSVGATQAGQVLGTPSYMSPEQSEGSATVGPSADVYSLGSILYEILCGRAPHPGTSRSEVLLRMQQEEPPLPSTFAQVPPALEAVCLRCMARKPDDRYVTAADVTQDIERWLADEPVSAFREPLITRLARWGRKHKTAMTATWVLLAAAVVGLSLGSYLINRQKMLAVQAKVEADENRRISERRMQPVRDMAMTLVFDVFDTFEKAGPTVARDLLVVHRS